MIFLEKKFYFHANIFYCLLLQHGCNAQTLYTDTVVFNEEYLNLKLTTNSKWINITWFSCSPARKYYYTLEVINRNIEMSYLKLRNLNCSIWNHFLLPVGTFPTERIHFQDKQFSFSFYWNWYLSKLNSGKKFLTWVDSQFCLSPRPNSWITTFSTSSNATL